ncbi:MAG: signal peptidase II, partial [Candidatus Marinimicrobia bacterium CG_4_9_14_3_um_filter_48_9]
PYKTVVLTIFPVLLTLFALGYLILEKNLTLGEMICIASVIGGGMSNLYDRILHQGTVTDFMNFGIGPWLRTGILNTADLSITLGAVALVWLQMYRNKKDPKSI